MSADPATARRPARRERCDPAHDEAVTRLTALWYGWEQAHLPMTGMLPWLRELDHQLPVLYGDDGPFRNALHPVTSERRDTTRRRECQPSRHQRTGGSGGTDTGPAFVACLPTYRRFSAVCPQTSYRRARVPASQRDWRRRAAASRASIRRVAG
ncbi:DUF4913 domain-containing protein [Micromonospora sp. CA-259024]|uniref:DUF4913 domain-containing protein n=1 Tax=Micromonospora sp. CA-259024 TaxID=3239965 RepID=UPI003D91AB9D